MILVPFNKQFRHILDMLLEQSIQFLDGNAMLLMHINQVTLAAENLELTGTQGLLADMLSSVATN